MKDSDSNAAGKNFRDYLRSADDPRLAGIESMNAVSWADHVMATPRGGPLFANWKRLYEETEFYGVTTDGSRIEGLFDLADEDAPVAAISNAASDLLSHLSADDRRLISHDIDAREWRAWMNPEVYMNRFGLRLEDVDEQVRDKILDVLRASLSDTGYRKVRDLMRINHFLGELVNGPGVLNEYSYNFNLFGQPNDGDKPWGWNFYGHHVCLCCLLVGRQMVLTPVFMGAEPDHIDSGVWSGTRVFDAEEQLALTLMRGLNRASREQAHLYPLKRDPHMPPGRVAIADELQLCGAFQDNRVVPLQGASVGEFTQSERVQLMALVGAYFAYLPSGPFAARMRDVERHLDATWFCWIGGTADDSPFYYRIQSPVLIIEFDHHAGVFLGNDAPEKFHIHTLIRTPNGNDYGRELIKRCCGCSSK